MKKGKQKIVVAAFELILQKGIKETSVRDIAKAAGISVGTFTYHYPSKEELLFDIFEMTTQKQDILLKEAFSCTDLDEKKRALENMLEPMALNAYFMKLNYYLVGEAFAENILMLEKLKEKYSIWRIEFSEYLYGEIKAQEKESLLNASLLLALIDGIALQLLLDEESIDVKTAVYKIMELLYNED